MGRRDRDAGRARARGGGRRRDTTNNKMELTAAIQALTEIRARRPRRRCAHRFDVCHQRHPRVDLGLATTWVEDGREHRRAQSRPLGRLDAGDRARQRRSRVALRARARRHPGNERVDEIADGLARGETGPALLRPARRVQRGDLRSSRRYDGPESGAVHPPRTLARRCRLLVPEPRRWHVDASRDWADANAASRDDRVRSSRRQRAPPTNPRSSAAGASIPTRCRPPPHQATPVADAASRADAPTQWARRSAPGISRRFKYEAWTRIPEVEIVALYNRTRRPRPSWREYGVPRYYADWKEMLDRERPDFVDIITPPETHEEMCALRGGARHPHHLSEAAGADLRSQPSASSSRSTAPACGSWCTRTSAGSRGIARSRTFKRAGDIGDFTHIHFLMRMGDGWGEDAYLARQPFFREYPRLLIYETGVHFIDTFRFLLGDVASVVAETKPAEPGHPRRRRGTAVA